uniref:Putative ribosome-binding factor A, chloroplastic n=1 Tax=Anthurium amnicola TaxID=1678845 RepID=A0A1D1Y6E2_9ARAE
MAPPCQALRSPPPTLRTSPAAASPVPSSCCSLTGRRRLLTHIKAMVLTSGGSSSSCSVRGRRTGTTCMANPRRVKMVAKQIRRELSDMLLTDKVLQYAVLPEASLGADRYLSSLTTISDVEVSGDLQVVKVYVSIFGDERGREVAMAGLKSKAKYVRSELGKRMKLRLTPEIRFIEDESLERGSRVIAILDRLKNEKKDMEDQEMGDPDSSIHLQEDDDDNWDIGDTDEGIVYIK